MKISRISKRSFAHLLSRGSLLLFFLLSLRLQGQMVTDFSTLLLMLLCVLTAFGVWLFRPDSRPGPARLKAVLKRVIAVLLSLSILSFLGIEGLILSHSKGSDNPQGRILLVLGAGLRGDIPSAPLQSRLEKTLSVLRQHPDMIALLSGGQGPGETVPEATAMRLWLLNRGIEPHRLLTESRSRNTWQNLTYSRRLLEQIGLERQPVVILSNGYHLLRASFLAARVGLWADTVSAPLPKDLPLWLYSHLRESFAVVKSFFADK